jgi:hypothetical protein
MNNDVLELTMTITREPRDIDARQQESREDDDKGRRSVSTGSGISGGSL